MRRPGVTEEKGLIAWFAANHVAANLLMMLGRYDYLPVDSWARKVVSIEWFDGQPVEDAQVEAAFEPWGEWKGLAYWFWDWEYMKQ